MSDSFLESGIPLTVLVEAAKAGREKEVGRLVVFLLILVLVLIFILIFILLLPQVEEHSLVFTEHSNKLVEVDYKFKFKFN